MDKNYSITINVTLRENSLETIFQMGLLAGIPKFSWSPVTQVTFVRGSMLSHFVPNVKLCSEIEFCVEFYMKEIMG